MGELQVQTFATGVGRDKNPGLLCKLTLNPPTENSKGLRIGNFVQIRDVVDEELESVWSGKKDAKTALDEYDTLTPPIRALYKERRDAFVGALNSIGWDVTPPKATFYVWIPCPKGYTSTELCARILDEADVVTTPGLGFGRTADGYIRAALTVDTPRLLQAVERIGKLNL